MAEQLDVSARAGLLLGAAAVGASFQRGLLSRASMDQALITGVAAVSGYGWGATAHSLLRFGPLAGARREAGGEGSASISVARDAAIAVAGVLGVSALSWREHEPGRRARARLACGGVASAAAAGLGARLLAPRRPRSGRVWVDLAAALAVGTASYALTGPRSQVTGADSSGGRAQEDSSRSVSPLATAGISVGVTTVLLGFAHGESHVSGVVARSLARAVGADEAVFRPVGRLGAFALTGAVAWRALSLVVTRLERAGEGMEVAHTRPPELAEVSGSSHSLVDWSAQSREGRRWLSMVLLADRISSVMGEPATQPIRVYASLASADSPEERADVLLREIDRTRALERSVFALFSPTGSGYVNYVADETLEYLTRGDCASAAIEYSVLPSSLSLTHVGLGTRQTRLVVDGVVQRLLAMPVDQRPRFVLFGESLGSQVSQEMFLGSGVSGPAGAGLEAALWIGTPAATRWAREIWGRRTVAAAPLVGPGAAYVSRCTEDWHGLPPEERARVRYLLLQNGDDPIPKFGAPVLWRRPDWLGPDAHRPPGAPRGTRWLPVITFVATFIDMINALTPTPGTFAEGGHDYRAEVPETLRTLWRLECSDEQMERVQRALRQRELGWETDRRWAEAEARPAAERKKAERVVESEVAQWTGQQEPLAAAAVEEIIARDIEPT